MGYRTYIGLIPKKEYNKIKSLTKEELIKFYNIKVDDDGDWYKGVYEYGEELYNFGKYTNFEPPIGSMKPFFKKKCLKQRYEEYDFYVVTKEFLSYLIGTYEEQVKGYYNKMMTPFFGDGNYDKIHEFLNTIKTEYCVGDNQHTFDFTKITKEQQTQLFHIIEHMRSMRTEWVRLTPYNLNKGDEITTSWKYEYGIFELVRIYKSFDWKKNVMVYYGY